MIIPSIHSCRARSHGENSRFTKAEWFALLEKYGDKCLICGGADISPDHVIPLSCGGSNLIENIQPLCLSCNIAKGIKAIDYRTTPPTVTEVRTIKDRNGTKKRTGRMLENGKRKVARVISIHPDLVAKIQAKGAGLSDFIDVAVRALLWPDMPWMRYQRAWTPKKTRQQKIKRVGPNGGPNR